MRYTSELTVNLAHLAHNVELLRSDYTTQEIIFMVKANAYGHGILEITSFAYYELGIKNFGCASLGEAIEIRKNLPEITAQVYVFSDTEILNSKYYELYTDFNILPVIQTKNELECFLAQSEFKNFPIILKLDSGMHRLGVSFDELEEIIQLLKSKGRNVIHHFMTHFANSYFKFKDNDKTSKQLETFNRALDLLGSNGIEVENTSCANSGAIVQKLSLKESFIRPGLMLYGHSSMLSNELWPAKVISSLKTKCIKKFEIKKGTPIGYGGHVCHDDGVIVYIPLGYGDGIATNYSGANIKINNEEAKLLGRVSMDVSALFFKNNPKDIDISSSLELWHDQSSVEQWCHEAKISAYQLFTGISSRVPRRYSK